MFSRKGGGRWLVFSILALFAWQGISISSADVALDGSLGTSGPLAGPDFTIDAVDGRTVGSNLFHSFSEFNLSSSQSATFTGPASINNVLGRVTGGTASSIDGLVRSTIPNANLFLVNPHGMMFGPNASLDVQGSFHASTADYIELADGSQFTALPSGQDTLLTTATPAAFGFLGNNPGFIDIDHSQLAVPQGQTLSLVGGDVSITGTDVDTNGARLATDGGTVNVISVSSPGEATFTSPLSADGFADYGDITVTEGTIDVSGDTSGAVYIQGGQLVIESANVFSDTAAGDGGDITFKGDGVMVRTDISGGGQVRTSTSGVGDGGNIRVEADSLQVIDGARLRSDTTGSGAGGDIVADVTNMEVMTGSRIETFVFDSGRGGDITVNADNVTVSGHEPSYTGIQAIVFGPFFIPDYTDLSPGASGNGGNIAINARDIQVTSGATIEARTYGIGNAGDVGIAAQHVLVDGNNLNRRTRIRSSAGDGDIPFVSFDLTDVIQGNGGEVSIGADILEMHSRGRIETSTFGAGTSGDLVVDVDILDMTTGANLINRNAGSGGGSDVRVNADSIFISGGGIFTTVSGPFFFGNYGDLSPGASGDGGNITVNARDVNLISGSIETATYGTGRGGDVTIEVDRVSASNPESRRNTGLRVRVGDGDIPVDVRNVIQGDAGNLTVKARRVEVRDGAIFDTATFGAGRAGNLTVEADNVVLSGDGSRRNTALRAETFGTGNGGRLMMRAGKLEVLDLAFVSASTLSVGTGGNVIIEADEVFVAGGNGIRVETHGSGNAGTLTVRANGLEVQGPASVSATTTSSGVGGTITIEASDILVSGFGANINAVVLGSGNGGIVAIKADHVKVRDNGAIASSTFADGRAGDIAVEADDIFLVGDGTFSPILTGIVAQTTGAATGSGGDVRIVANSLKLQDGAEINVKTFGDGDGGSMTIDVGHMEMRNGAQLDASSRGAGRGGDISVDADSFLASSDGSSALTFTGVTSSAFDIGDAGNVSMNVSQLDIRDNAQIASSTSGIGRGGTITIRGTDVYLADGGEITTASTGAGAAGNISITVADSFQSKGSSVTTATTASDGGNITLNAINLVHLANSSITTSVQGGAGAGGNITIDPQFVILNNSNITANAFGGPGGNIRIVAGNFFATPNSVIQASSAQSIAGTIQIDSPDTDITGSITELPESFLDASSLLPQHCAARNSNGQSSFVVAGRGGTPPDPDGYLPSFHAASLTILSASTDSVDNIPDSWLRTNNVALLNLGCR